MKNINDGKLQKIALPFALCHLNQLASQFVLVVKNTSANAGDTSSVPWVRKKIRWRRKWQPTPVFLPGRFHGQRNLVSYIQSMGPQRVEHN